MVEENISSAQSPIITLLTLLIICTAAFQLLLFICGVILIIIAEIHYYSLAEEFEALLDAHILGFVLPLFGTILLFLRRKQTDQLRFLLDITYKYSILAFFSVISHKALTARKIILALLVVTISIISFRYYYNNSLDTRKKNIVFLFPKVMGIPDIIFEISILPTVIVQHITSSPKQIIALPLLSTTIEDIAAHSEVIIIGAHGKNGYFRTRDAIAFSSSMILSSNTAVKEIYFGCCYIGKDAKGWQEKFQNSRIFYTNGEFSQLQGLYYLLIIAPFKYS
jgi:hypothetical protein